MTISRPLQALAQSSSLVARNAAFRLAALVLVLLWGVDRAVYCFTEASWFGSLGMSALWRSRCETEIVLFGLALLTGWAVAAGPLSAVARLAQENGPVGLRPALRRLEPWRLRVSTSLPRLVTASLLGFAWVFTKSWPQWLALHGPLTWGAREPHFGWDVGLWVLVLPPLEKASGLLFWFCLLVLALTAVGGTLAALPQLLRPVPRPAAAWARSLWLQLTGVLLLRAGALILDALDLASGSGLTFASWYFTRPLLLGCAAATALMAGGALVAAWHPLQLPRRRAVLLTLLVGWGMPLLVPLLGVAGLVAPAGPFLTEARAAQEVAWGIDGAFAAAGKGVGPEPAGGQVKGGAPSWPVWDEVHLISAARQGGPFHWVPAGVVNWEVAAVTASPEGWTGVVAGYPPAAEQLFAFHADESSALRLLRVDPTDVRDGIPAERAATPLRLSFFGLEGPPLVTSLDEREGVDVSSWAAKLAWAWRLRDPVLPFQAASARRLLVWRGAAERAAHLVPWLVPADAGHPVLAGGSWYWELDLLGTSATFPGSQLVPGGQFGGANAAWDAVKMLMDAHSGAIRFYAVPRRAADAPTPPMPENPGPILPWSALPADLKSHLRYPDALLAVQGQAAAEDLDARDHGDFLQEAQSLFDGALVPPMQALSRGGGAINRLVLLGPNRVLEVEAAEGLHYGTVLARSSELSSVGALERLDHARSAMPLPRDVISEPGPPFFWKEPGTTNAWWVAQPCYQWTEEAMQSPAVSGNGARLSCVLVVNTLREGTAVGGNLESALRNWHSMQSGGAMAGPPEAKRAASKATPSPPPVWGPRQDMAQQALAAHDLAVSELAAGQPQAAERDLEKERHLLEALAR